MKILHISDFHLSPGDDSNLLREGYVEEFVGSLCNSLREELPIDLLVVTGDLVHQGKFKSLGAAKNIIDLIAAKLEIQKSGILICPGNHDFVWRERKRTEGSKKAFAALLSKYCLPVQTLKANTPFPFASLYKPFDECHVLVFDSMFNSPSFAKPSIIERSLLDQTIKLVRDHIPQRTANLLILSHYPVILSPIDPGKLEENNFERHVWKEATELVARLCAAVEKETNLLWFSGDIHRGEIVYPSVKDRAILVSVAGRLGGTAHFGRGPTVHLVEIKNHQITTHTCEWQAEGHDNKKHSMGTWKLRKNASQGKNSQGRTKKKEVSSNRPLVNSLKNSIEVTVAHDLEQEIVASIAKYRWLHLGRFATSRSSGATLLWLNTDEFFGHEDALLEEIIRRLVEQMRERLPAITNDNLNAFMLGIDAYGSLIASLVGSSLGLPVVCAAVNGGTSNKAIFRKVDKGLLRGYLKERSVIILVSDVVRTGRSVAEVIAEIKSAHEELQKEGHNSLLHTPIFHLVSVVLNRDGSQWLQQLADDVESILCCCQSIDLMLIDDNKLPPLELLPNTRFLVS